MKRDRLQAQKKVITTRTTQSKATLKASYVAATGVARSKKPFMIAEEFILLITVDMC